MKTAGLLITLFFYGLVNVQARAYECDITNDNTDLLATYDYADVVVEGMVISSEDIRENEDIMRAMTWTYGAGVEDRIWTYRRTRILVLNSFKGEQSGLIDVWTDYYQFHWEHTGERRIFFLGWSNGVLVPVICNRFHFSETDMRDEMKLDGTETRTEYLERFRRLTLERPQMYSGRMPPADD